MFQTIKKLALTLVVFFTAQFSVLAQTERDLGILFSGLEGNGIALEYRQMMGDTYRMRLGLTYNSNNNLTNSFYDEIVMVSDSLITQRVAVFNQNDVGIRFGFLNQVSESVFSVGADLNVAYRSLREGYYLQQTQLNPNGRWEINPTTAFPPFDNPGGSYVTRHFLGPTIRLAINADVPLGTSALVHFEIAYGANLPIYMGASNVQLQPNEIVGTPATTFNAMLSAGLGLRYKLGSR